MADKQKENIRATQILNRLTGFVMNEPGVNGEKIALSSAQVAASKIILAKIIPDMKSVEMEVSNPDGSLSPKDITVKIVK